MNSNLFRTLNLLETLSETPETGFSTSEIIEQANIAPSTLYRLLSEMEEAGYLYRNRDRRFLPNFSFERRIATGAISPKRLSDACREISLQLQTASEIILRREHNLLWHITFEQPQQAIRLRAHPGYVRATYELDSISRLALSYCPIADIERSWDLSAFYDVGVEGTKVNWNDARKTILSTDNRAMQFDMQGNAKGVRRFCIAVTDAENKFICLLTAAEAATPLRNENRHIERIRSVLTQARESLKSDDPEEIINYRS